LTFRLARVEELKIRNKMKLEAIELSERSASYFGAQVWYLTRSMKIRMRDKGAIYGVICICVTVMRGIARQF